MQQSSHIPIAVSTSLSSRLVGEGFACERIAQSSFSGTPIFRITTEARSYALRAWPDALESLFKINNQVIAESLFKNELSSQINFGAQSGGRWDYSPVPRFLDWTEHNDKTASRAELVIPSLNRDCPYALREGQHLWTLSEWVPGAPVTPYDLQASLSERAIQFVAAFHRATSSIDSRFGHSIGMAERLNVLRELKQGIDFLRFRSVPIQQELLSKSLEILHWGALNEARLFKAIARQNESRFQMHWIVRDFWRENILMDQAAERLYVVDFGASRCDAPFLDVIRLVGSLQTSFQGWAEAWETYEEVRGTALEIGWESGLAFHRVSTIGAILFWFRRLQTMELGGSSPNTLSSIRRSPNDIRPNDLLPGSHRIIELAEIRLGDLAKNWYANFG